MKKTFKSLSDVMNMVQDVTNIVKEKGSDMIDKYYYDPIKITESVIKEDGLKISKLLEVDHLNIEYKIDPTVSTFHTFGLGSYHMGTILGFYNQEKDDSNPHITIFPYQLIASLPTASGGSEPAFTDRLLMMNAFNKDKFVKVIRFILAHEMYHVHQVRVQGINIVQNMNNLSEAEYRESKIEKDANDFAAKYSGIRLPH